MLKGSRVVVRIQPAQGQQIAKEMPSSLLRIALHAISIRRGRNRSNPASTGVCVVKRLPARVTAKATSNGMLLSSIKARAFQNRERRVAFIQMANFGMEPERAQQTPAADAQHAFLLQAQFRSAAVEFAGDASVSG